ncbi:MAG: hypothetical protein M1594_02690 [Candidatus Marsarchaeota archaeon]|nr:hypothetical protein [Candidatus Marsarchaeota archaeon]
MNKVLLALLFILPASVIAFPMLGANATVGVGGMRNNTGIYNGGMTGNASVNSSEIAFPTLEANANANVGGDNMILSSSERERMSTLVDRGLQNALERLQNIEARLESQGMNVTGLNESISNIAQIEQNLNASIQTGNLTEIRNYTNQLVEEFVKTRDAVNEEVRTYQQNKIQNTIEVAGGLMNRIQGIISQLKSQGVNVTVLQQEFNQIQLQLNETNSTIRGEHVSEAAHLMFRLRDMLLNFRDDMISTVNHMPPEHANMEAETANNHENVSAQENESINETQNHNQTGSVNETNNESINETQNHNQTSNETVNETS